MTERPVSRASIDADAQEIVRRALALPADVTADALIRAGAFHELRDCAQRSVLRRRVVLITRRAHS